MKWGGGVLGQDNCIYGIPYHAASVLQYGEFNRKTELLGLPDYSGTTRFPRCNGGVLDKDGHIFAIPNYSREILQRNPSLARIGSKDEPNDSTYDPTKYQAGGIRDSPNDEIDRLGFELYAKSLVKHVFCMEKSGQTRSNYEAWR